MKTLWTALMEPNRLHIVEQLRDGPLTVGEITKRLGLQQPQVSKHLKVLQRAGLITQGRRAQWRPCRLETAPPPVVFIDGSLVLSFIHRMVPAAQSGYLHALFQLLDTSEEQGVPVAGFIDLSYARDLTGMLKTAFSLPDGNVFDAALLSERMQPLDRTAAFVTARGDVLPHYRSPRKDWSTEMCFVYVKTGADRLPARIDFPRWMLRQGVLDHALDIIRAEVVVGSGYPYALETADAAAVLTTEDRLQFYRLFHRFAEDTGLDILLPGKSVSKGHRR